MDTSHNEKNKVKKHKTEDSYGSISYDMNIQVNTIKTMARLQEEFVNIVSEMTLEEVLININLISKIEPNYKLLIKDNFINIDTSYIQSISRWFYGNDRNSTLLFLNLVINKSFEYCDKLLSSKNIDTKLLFRITLDIKNSINGLLNLKQTYSYDKLVQAEIDVIIENIRNKIESNTTKLNL
jgi:hypothetical protein